MTRRVTMLLIEFGENPADHRRVFGEDWRAVHFQQNFGKLGIVDFGRLEQVDFNQPLFRVFFEFLDSGIDNRVESGQRISDVTLPFFGEAAISVIGADEALVAGNDSGAHRPVVVIDEAELEDKVVSLFVLYIDDVDELLGVGRQHADTVPDVESGLGQPVFEDPQGVVMLNRSMEPTFGSIENFAKGVEFLLLLEDGPVSAVDDGSGFEKRAEVRVYGGSCVAVHFQFPFSVGFRYLNYHTLLGIAVKCSNLITLGIFDRCGYSTRFGEQLGKPSAGFPEFNLGFDIVDQKSEVGS